MEKKYKNNDKLKIYLLSFIVNILFTGLFILIFSAVLFFLEKGFNYAPIFATVAVAIGSLAASYFAANKMGNKGLLNGFLIGIFTFIIILLISLIVDKGAITINTFFHFIIIMLASLIGGVMGVNKKSQKKYI